MKAHSEQYCLTPTYKPFYMIGYNSPLRDLPAQGVHDDIYVTTTLLDFNDQKLFLFSTDWLHVEDEIVSEIRERLQAQFNQDPKLVLISATHNHQSVRDHMQSAKSGQFNQESHDHVLDLAVRGYQECSAQLEEVECWMGRKVIPGYYGSRIVYGELADNEVILVEFRNAQNQVVAAICNWAVHSTVITPDNALLTAEFAGNVRRLLKERKGYAPAMIVGAAGDCSTRATRQGNDFNELQRVAQGMAEEISKIEVNEKLELEFERIASTEHHVRYPIDHKEVQRIIDANEEELKTCQDFDRRKILNSMMSGLRRKLTMDEARADWFADTLRLKDIEIVVSPCELASKFGKEIKRLSPAKCCLIFGYTNGRGSYLFPKEYYGLTFETISSGIPAEEVENYINKIIAIL